MEGVGFYISKRISSAVIEFEGISSRIARVRLNTKWFKVTVIALYAPTEDSNEENKDQWYDEVQEVLNKVPGHDMLVILGDLNAKVGRETAAFNGILGEHSLHEVSNDNGLRVATLASQYNLVVGGTLFPHKVKHKGTWLSPDGNTTHQIDHVLVKRKFRTSLLDVRAYRGADCDSDHYLVISRIRLKLATKRTRVEGKAKIDVEKLKEAEERLQYQIEVDNRFAALEDEGEENWEYVKRSMVEAAERSVGRSRRRRRNGWFNGECKNAADKRKKTRMKWIEDRGNMEKRRIYTGARNEACRINRRNKRLQIDRELEQVENSNRHGNTRAEFQGINNIRKGYQARQGMIKNSNGDLLITKEEISERWAEHFVSLLNRPPPQEPVPLMDEIEMLIYEEEVEEPTTEEILSTIRGLKNNKAAGIDEITAELIKYGGRRLHDAMAKIVIRIWRREEMPPEWEEGMFIPVH